MGVGEAGEAAALRKRCHRLWVFAVESPALEGERGVLELPASAVGGALVGAFQLARLQLVKRNCWAVALKGVVGGHRAGRSAEAATLVASRPSALGADPRSEGCRLGSWWGSPASQRVS